MMLRFQAFTITSTSCSSKSPVVTSTVAIGFKKSVEQLSQLLQGNSINDTGTASVSQTPFADK
jgi:hypothetical protein